MKLITFLLIFPMLGCSSARATQAFYLTPSKGADCPHEQIIDRVLSKQDFHKSKSSDARPSFIDSNDCAGSGINIGINGQNYLLDKLHPEELGVPVEYFSESNDVRVKIEHVDSIYKDDQSKIETDPGKFCVPEFRKVKVTIQFNGARKTLFGTALGNCP